MKNVISVIIAVILILIVISAFGSCVGGDGKSGLDLQIENSQKSYEQKYPFLD